MNNSIRYLPRTTLYHVALTRHVNGREPAADGLRPWLPLITRNLEHVLAAAGERSDRRDS